MKLDLAVVTHSGDYKVTTNLMTVIAWERRFKAKASTLANGVGAEDLAFLAFEASKQAGIETPIVFDDFLKTLVSVDVVEDQPVTPT